jgi:hypothetical protein
MLQFSSRFGPKKGVNFPFFIEILTGHNLLILYEIGIKLSGLIRPEPSSRNF